MNGSEAPLRMCVVGALVAELGIDGRVEWTGSKFVAVGQRPHGLLGEVHAALAADQARRATRQFPRLDRSLHGARGRVVDGLVEAGALGRERRRIWLPTAHPLLTAEARDEPLARVRSAAAGDGPIDARTAVLLALAGPARLLELVADKPHAHAKRRIAQAAEFVPAADVVRKVIAEAAAAAATSAAVIAATTAASS